MEKRYLQKEENLDKKTEVLEQKEERLIIPGAFSTEEFKIALKDFTSGNIKDKTFI